MLKNNIFHVSSAQSDKGDGSIEHPYSTITEASRAAQAGDMILVQEGVYRERIDPPRGGNSEQERIVYKAAPDAKVVIKGSEVIDTWEKDGDLWKAIIPNSIFGEFNPFEKPLDGHWFYDHGRKHHLGSVYQNNHWLTEAANLEELRYAQCTSFYKWYAEVKDDQTTIWAQLTLENPNDGQVEVSVRESIFYPSQENINYITVDGFELLHAATPWAAPTTEQIGLIGTNWSKGWIIQNNRVSYSKCSGITLGKYYDADDFKPLVEFTEKDTYHITIEKALEHGWNKENVGSHIVKNNMVSHCEMAGICGSLGAIFSTIENNEVHHIYQQKLFFGYEMAGIKFHGAIDSLIRNNHVHHCYRGLWLDWMSQGTRITQNLFHHNGPLHDVFMEVNHGPFVFDNNILLSENSLQNWSEGGLYAHNMFAGKFETSPVLDRTTPYHPEHKTDWAGCEPIQGGDDRFYNNIFFDPDWKKYQSTCRPIQCQGNAELCSGESQRIITFIISTKTQHQDSISLKGSWNNLSPSSDHLISTEHQTPNAVTQLMYKDYNGDDLCIALDFYGNVRTVQSNASGPFADIKVLSQEIVHINPERS